MNRLSIIFLLCPCWISLGSDPVIRFAMVSDVHAGDTYVDSSGPTNFLRYIYTNYAPDFVIFCGDNSTSGCGTGGSIAFTGAWSVITCPKYVIPGNHDYCDGTASGKAQYQTYISASPQFAFSVSNYNFIGAEMWSSSTGFTAQISVDGLDWVTNQLASHTNYVNVVIGHHPIDATDLHGGGPLNNIQGNAGGTDLSNFLANYSVPLYIHGHAHYSGFYTRMMNGGATRQLANPSLWQSIGGSPFSGIGAFNICWLSNTTLHIDQYVASETNGYSALGSTNFTVPRFTNEPATTPSPTPTGCSPPEMILLSVQLPSSGTVSNFYATNYGTPLAWYSPAGISSFGSTNVITNWSDGWINGWHLTNAGVANLPKSATKGSLNGFSTAIFDGSDDYLRQAAFTSPPPVEVWMVLKNRGTTNIGANKFILDSVNTSFRTYLVQQPSSTIRLGNSGTLDSPTISDNLTNKWFVLTVMYRAGASATMWTNNVIWSNAGIGMNGTWSGITLSAKNDLTGAIWYEYAEIIIYSATNTTANRALIYSGFTNTYGTSNF